jgi:hypothetical protein
LVVRGLAVREVVVSVALMASLLGCREPDSWTILGASAGPLVLPAQRGEKANEKRKVEDWDERADVPPRHVYRSSDMLLNPCTRLDSAGAIVGKGCPGGFVVFGPYASISGNSDVRIRFEIESNAELVLSGDVVSNMAALHHGELGNQTIRPDAKRQLRYRANLPEGGEALEARIFLRPADDAEFKISNFEMAVR